MSIGEAAGVFLFYKGSVLLCKRALTYNGEKVKFGGYWSPFAGAVEKNENPLACAVRELKEESGFILKNYDLRYIITLDRGPGDLVLYAHELSDLFCPELDAEHTEYGYFALDSIRTHPSPLDPPIREAIEYYNHCIRI